MANSGVTENLTLISQVQEAKWREYKPLKT